MKSTIEKQVVPLAADDDGVFHVGGTRVTLDTVVSAFESGCTCEEIAQQYPQEQVRAEALLAPSESNREIRDRLLRRRQTG